jgi:hypothetical protein
MECCKVVAFIVKGRAVPGFGCFISCNLPLLWIENECESGERE